MSENTIPYYEWAAEYREEAEQFMNLAQIYTERAKRSRPGDAMECRRNARSYRKIAAELFYTAKLLRRYADENAVS